MELYARESHALSQDRSFITARKITKKNTLRFAWKLADHQQKVGLDIIPKLNSRDFVSQHSSPGVTE